MTHTVKCPECDWAKDYKGETKAKQGLNGHINRKHRTRTEKKKRKYTRKKAATKSEPLTFDYCPCCGTNVRLVNRAIIMSQKL